MTTLTDTQVITASGGLVELGYSQITSNVAISSSSVASPTTVISPITIVSDGSPILVEFFAPYVTVGTTAGAYTLLNITIDGTTSGRWGTFTYSATNNNDGGSNPVYLSRRLTLAAGSHTIGVVGWYSVGSGNVGAGPASTADSTVPAFLRVSKIVQATQWPAVTTGTIICTSSTRPASPFVGQSIYETDTSLSLTWSGSAWVSPPLAFKPPSVRCLATGTSQTLPTGALTAITFPAEDYDTDSMHSTSSNTSRVTVPYAGLYLVNNYITTGAAGGNRYIYILKNGAQWMFKAAVTDPTSSSSAGIVDSICAIVPCAANDYIESGIFHNTGSAISVGTGSWMSVSYFGKYT